MTAAEIIRAKGAKAIADKVGVPAGRVRAWTRRNKIPRVAWPELIDAFPDLTMDTLKQSEAA